MLASLFTARGVTGGDYNVPTIRGLILNDPTPDDLRETIRNATRAERIEAIKDIEKRVAKIPEARKEFRQIAREFVKKPTNTRKITLPKPDYAQMAMQIDVMIAIMAVYRTYLEDEDIILLLA